VRERIHGVFSLFLFGFLIEPFRNDGLGKAPSPFPLPSRARKRNMWDSPTEEEGKRRE